jgi:TM2 domain-containing membrane protein YozV
VPDEAGGKRAKCPQCATVLTIPVPAATAPVFEAETVPNPPPYDAASAGPPPFTASVSSAAPPSQIPADVSGKRLAAGICGILIGGLGIHKFVLGLTTPGIIMLLVTILTCGIGGIIMGPIGLIEGILYLVKSDEEFYQRYMVEKQGWF